MVSAATREALLAACDMPENGNVPWRKLDLPNDSEKRRMDAEFRGWARFLVDESMGKEVAEILQSNGYNTKYVAEIGLAGRSDEDVFAAAWKERRIIVTHDPDFLDCRRFPQHRNRGIVLVRPGSSGRDNRGLLACLIKATWIAGEHATWFQGRKLDFSSEEFLTITNQSGQQRFWWAKLQDLMVWDD
jgi:predicted nuclease of predicted toxin-antitoxin system